MKMNELHCGCCAAALTVHPLTDCLANRMCESLFQHNAEGIMLTDAAAVILRVNQAFSCITGFSAAEVLGKTPAILRSSHHDAGFYQQMWAAISTTGSWQGRIWNRRKDNSVYQQWLKITAIYNEHKQITHYLSVFQDLSIVRLHDQQHRKLLTLDNLTGLGNRELLVSRFPQILAQCRALNLMLHVVWIDGGQLTQVNQQHGLKYGDLLIKAQAQTLKAAVSPEQTLVRLYADDYVVLAVSACTDTAVETQLQGFIDGLSQSYLLDDIQVSTTPAIGVARYPLDGDSEEQLLQAAETALFHAKKQGGGRVCFYNARQAAASVRRHQIKHLLSAELTAAPSELSLYFQAKVVMQSRKICGAEVLLRWYSGQLGWVSPAEFIAIAEESRLIIQLDRWVINELCRVVQLLPEQRRPLISFNVSARQLSEADFADWLLNCLQRHNLPAAALEMEVTESAFIDNPAQAMQLLSRLRKQGLRIALDDFGTGYSSLVYLKNMPLDTVKIDRSVIFDVTSNYKSQCILKRLHAMLQDLQLAMVVEGVETEVQHQLLHNMGCEVAQGFFYGKPMPVEQFCQLLQGSTLC